MKTQSTNYSEMPVKDLLGVLRQVEGSKAPKTWSMGKEKLIARIEAAPKSADAKSTKTKPSKAKAKTYDVDNVNDLAKQLDVKPRTLRARLRRSKFNRKHPHRTAWHLTPEMIDFLTSGVTNDAAASPAAA